jgi:hypothetical protein
MALVSKNFSDIITFTRASTATYFSSAGVLTSAAVDAPRLDYNPSTLAAQGFLVEESRTNSIRNNTMVGAVAGTPGTAPTNWALQSGGTLSVQVVATGVENGIAYIDVRFFGTNTSGLTQFPSVFFETSNGIAATAGQAWAGSFYLRLVAGTGSNFDTAIHDYDSGGVFLRSTIMAGGSGVPVTGSLSTGRRAGVATTGASTAFVRPLIACTVLNGASHDVTIRIGLPQLELGAFATSVIPTATTALTRAADVASVNTLSPWYNATTGTIYAEGVSANFANFPFFVQFHDSTANNTIATMYRNTGAARIEGTVGGVAWTPVNTANTITAGTVGKAAFAWTASDQAAVLNAGTAATGTNTTIPAVTVMQIGGSRTQADMFNGYLRRIVYYPRRLSNAELQSITS